MRAVSIASLFVGVAGQSITSCGGATDHLQNLKVTLTPDPIQKGKSFTLDVAGTLDEDFTAGTADLDLNVTALIQQSISAKADYSFAPAIVSKGDIGVTVGPISLPSIPIPISVTAKGKIAVKNSAGEPVFCLNLDLDVPALEEETTADPALSVLDPTPVSTCTKDSDHVKNLKVLVDKDALTADITGTLDEDIFKMNVHAALKVDTGFFPIPLNLDVPISLKPAVKKGDLKWHFSADHIPAIPKNTPKINGAITLQDQNGEEIACFNVVPPADESIVV